MNIMEYLHNAFAGGQQSYIIFVQAFGSASDLDVHNFWVAFNAMTVEEQQALQAIADSVNFTLPVDVDPQGNGAVQVAG